MVASKLRLSNRIDVARAQTGSYEAKYVPSAPLSWSCCVGHRLQQCIHSRLYLVHGLPGWRFAWWLLCHPTSGVMLHMTSTAFDPVTTFPFPESDSIQSRGSCSHPVRQDRRLRRISPPHVSPRLQIFQHNFLVHQSRPRGCSSGTVDTFNCSFTPTRSSNGSAGSI